MPRTSSARAETAPLHVGFLLDAENERVPVNLRGAGVTAHTAIVAQSGSGKSFFVGRLLEELISKTKARVVVIDPNSDFSKLWNVNNEVWRDTRFRTWFSSTDTRAAFRRRWARTSFAIATNRDMSPVPSNVMPARISITWGLLSASKQEELLDFSFSTAPAETYVFRQLRAVVQNALSGQRADAVPSLQDLLAYAGALWAARNQIPTNRIPKNWPSAPLEIESSATTAFNVYARLAELADLRIWDIVSERYQSLPELFHSDTWTLAAKTTVLDLGSLDHPAKVLTVANVALDALWRLGRELWVSAMEGTPAEDLRAPIFIVIDEAHNLASGDGFGTRAGEAVLAQLRQIAAEGRKYGLFLILITQRPSKVDKHILSQCDSLAVLKMTNRADLQLVHDAFGFIPESASRLEKLIKGEAMLAGSWVEKPVFVRTAPRRTAEGGRNLNEAHWLSDPDPPRR